MKCSLAVCVVGYFNLNCLIELEMATIVSKSVHHAIYFLKLNFQNLKSKISSNRKLSKRVSLTWYDKVDKIYKNILAFFNDKIYDCNSSKKLMKFYS